MYGKVRRWKKERAGKLKKYNKKRKELLHIAARIFRCKYPNIPQECCQKEEKCLF